MAHLLGLIAQWISLLQPIYINNDQILMFQGLFWRIVRFCISKIDWDMEKIKQNLSKKNEYPIAGGHGFKSLRVILDGFWPLWPQILTRPIFGTPDISFQLPVGQITQIWTLGWLNSGNWPISRVIQML